MNRTNLDERQLQKRNKAGNQAFMLMAFLLLADMGLHNYGSQWLDYPLGNYVIFLAGVGSYLVRLIWSGSYVGPGQEKITANGRNIIIGILAVLIAGCILMVTLLNPTVRATEDSASGAAILIISATVGLVILSSVYWIRRRNNRDEL